MKITDECHDIFSNIVKCRHDFWSYNKSKKRFQKEVCDDILLTIPTSLRAKGDFCVFEVSLHFVSPKARKLDVLRLGKQYASDILVSRSKESWVSRDINRGSGTVYRRETVIPSFDEAKRAGNAIGYLYIDELFDRMSVILDSANADIQRNFDLTSKEALLHSILRLGIGFFHISQTIQVLMLLGLYEQAHLILNRYSELSKDELSCLRYGIGANDIKSFRELLTGQELPKFDNLNPGTSLDVVFKSGWQPRWLFDL